MLVAIWVASFVVTAMFSFLCFDRIVRMQRARCNEAWWADGAPFGFFWKPEDLVSAWMPDNYPNYSARKRLSRHWVLKTPDWASSEPDILRAFRWYRISICAGFVTWLGATLSMISPA